MNSELSSSADGCLSLEAWLLRSSEPTGHQIRRLETTKMTAHGRQYELNAYNVILQARTVHITNPAIPIQLDTPGARVLRSGISYSEEKLPISTPYEIWVLDTTYKSLSPSKTPNYFNRIMTKIKLDILLMIRWHVANQAWWGKWESTRCFRHH